MVVKVRLKFKVTNVTDDHLLTLNLKNVGNRILKNMVVQMHSLDPRSLVDRTGCFIYALMPNAEENVKFRVFGSLVRAYFVVIGYANGDAVFATKSPVMTVRTIDSVNNSMLLT